MTELLQEVVDRVSKLPESEQNAYASIMLEEIRSEQKWDELFAKTQDKLALYARQALEDFKNGKTKELNTDDL